MGTIPYYQYHSIFNTIFQFFLISELAFLIYTQPF